MPSYGFVDLFAGCGGLSLGLSLAGFRGQFAIERDPMAFETLIANLGGERAVPAPSFDWPEWLEKKPWSIDELLSRHKKELVTLRGVVDVLAGGPPCQGYSLTGRRQETDPRNLLFEKYVDVVAAIKSKAIILENVPGMRIAHSRRTGTKSRADQDEAESFYDRLARSLHRVGYVVDTKLFDASQFGIPQKRSRLIVFGVRKDLADFLKGGIARAFQLLEDARISQLRELRLPPTVSAADAISDLEITAALLQPTRDPKSTSGFLEVSYWEKGRAEKKPISRADAIGSGSGSSDSPEPLGANPKGLIQVLADLVLEAAGVETVQMSGGDHEYQDHA
jgi:DNA (cytosine-5)-methyltransferase 1